jgi:MFS family permease
LKALYLFVAISSANHLAFTGARLAVILYATQLHASAAVVGVLSALFGLLSCFTSVSAGRLMDRIGPRRPMLWSSALMVLGSALAFAWRDLAALFLVSTLVGTFYSFFFLGHTQWIGRFGGAEERVKNISIASLGFSAASFIGPLATGFVIDELGVSYAFLMLALVPLFPMAVIGFNIIQAPPGRSERERAGTRQAGLMVLLRDRQLLRVFGVSSLAQATWSIVNFLIPVYGVQIGLSASTIGIIMGSYSFASIVIRALMPLLTGRFTTWQMMLMSLTFTGACFVVFPVLTSLPPLLAVAFCIGLGMGLAGPLSQALLYDASPPERVGEVLGLRVTAMNINQTVVPIAAGAVGAAVGVAPVFWALAALLVGGTYVTRAQWRYQGPRRAARPATGAAAVGKPSVPRTEKPPEETSEKL